MYGWGLLLIDSAIRLGNTMVQKGQAKFSQDTEKKMATFIVRFSACVCKVKFPKGS